LTFIILARAYTAAEWRGSISHPRPASVGVHGRLLFIVYFGVIRFINSLFVSGKPTGGVDTVRKLIIHM